MCFLGWFDSSLQRNLAPNISCGLGTECYRDISIDCCAETWLLMCFVSVGKVRFMSYVTSRARVHHNFRAYAVAGTWRCGRRYFGTG